MARSPSRAYKGYGVTAGYASDSAYLADSVGTPERGDFYYNTTEKTFRFFDGTNWRPLGAAEGAGAIFAADYFDTTTSVLPTGAPFAPDGTDVTDGETVLFTDPALNGIYRATVVAGDVTAWEQLAPLQDPAGTPIDGDFVYVRYGTVYGDRLFVYSTAWQERKTPRPGTLEPAFASSLPGDYYYDGVLSKYRYFDGIQWRPLGSGGGLIKVRAHDPVSGALPTGDPVIADGLTIVAGDRVLFTALASLNNQVFEAVGTGTNITGWSAVADFDGNDAPADGDTVIVQDGEAFADQIGKFDGTSWLFNEKVRYFNGADYWEQSAIYTQALADNQPTPADVFTFNAAGSENMVIDFSIVRGSAKETGILIVSSDGTDVELVRSGAVVSSAGISFTADLDSGNIRVRYTSTSTGSAATMKFMIRRWADAAGGPGGPPSYTGGGGGGTLTGGGANMQIAFWTSAINLAGNTNFQYDTGIGALKLANLKISNLNSAVLLDNQAAPALAFTLADTNKFVILEYSIERDGTFRVGRILITHDGLAAVFTDDSTETASTGVTIVVDLSGGNIRVRYTSTNTGMNGTLKWSARYWD